MVTIQISEAQRKLLLSMVSDEINHEEFTEESPAHIELVNNTFDVLQNARGA
jgi:hypothetical protein